MCLWAHSSVAFVREGSARLMSPVSQPRVVAAAAVPAETAHMTHYEVTRRGARVVESGGLENRCTRKGTVGSNPTLSAIKRFWILDFRFWIS